MFEMCENLSTSVPTTLAEQTNIFINMDASCYVTILASGIQQMIFSFLLSCAHNLGKSSFITRLPLVPIKIYLKFFPLFLCQHRLWVKYFEYWYHSNTGGATPGLVWHCWHCSGLTLVTWHQHRHILSHLDKMHPVGMYF